MPVPNVPAGEKLICRFSGAHAREEIVPDSIRELTDIRDGAVWLPANLDASYEVLFFISGRTGMQVKRPAVGGEGYVLNHMDRAATDTI